MKKKDLKNIILEAYEEVLIELNEAPDNMYYIKVKRTDKASLNGLQDVIETWYSPVKFADIVDDDGAGNVIFYINKKDWDPGMEDDIMGNGVQIVDTNMPLSEDKETDDYGRPHVDPKGSRTFLEPDEMLPHKRFKKMAHGVNESLLDEVEEEEPQPEEEGEKEGPVLEDATDQILGKFPTLKAAITKLQTDDFKEFVDTIDWISPRPTSFRINLKNGQDYILKWTGKTFEAQILGKRYLLSNIADYQQALDKLAVLYREAPMKGAGEEEAEDASDFGSADTGGGEFPGEEGGADVGGDDAGEEPPAEPADLSDEPVDFEAGEEPEA